MTAYTNELLNDPEKLDDMQQIDGESIEEWKKEQREAQNMITSGMTG